MDSPILTPNCPTGIFPAWIPVQDALPNTCRCVLATDGEGCWIGCCSFDLNHPLGYWEEASTEEPFDSCILAWMELPLVSADFSPITT